MEERYDFSGWATRNNLRCSDGRVILNGAFKSNDGQKVPLVWNHQHESPYNVLGHALLENREDGVYAYCALNDTEAGQAAKLLIKHGDLDSLSIYANQLKQNGGNVLHGEIREVSLVLSGANPGAKIMDVAMSHGEDGETEEAIIFTGEKFALIDDLESDKLVHADNEEQKEEKEEKESVAEESKKEEKTFGEELERVLKSLSEDDRDIIYAAIGLALEEEPKESNKETTEKKEEEDTSVKHNVFDNDRKSVSDEFLSHADQMQIINTAKQTGVGSFRASLNNFIDNSQSLQHGFDDDEIDLLFPDYELVTKGAPELIQRDQGWVTTVMNKAHKTPFSRIRTRQADIRGTDIRGLGYQKGNEKEYIGNIKLLNRTTDPQTVYVKDILNRDDINDITDFDVVQYIYGVMRQTLNEEIALAIMVGDGREEGETDKIYEEHIRSIWNDDDLYCIHTDVDIDSVSEELQGTNTSANFGENYIYAEAIIQASLYAREDFKGSGQPDFYCTPHLLNVMLLARDLNGRRIYDSKSDLVKALNVGEIYTVEQFEGLTRTDDDGNEKALLGIYVNLADYNIGSTKGGEITSFDQFDIDFNQQKYLIETRLSGALTRAYSAIALEEAVSSDSDSTDTEEES